jgi:Family of unknown function (DUF6311)
MMKETSSRWRINLIVLSIGLASFLLVSGHLILVGSNIQWLGGNLDPAQHYLGWALFRDGPWTFPLGLNPNNGLEFSNAIVFSDSLPLFAIPFKSLAHFLPYPFQYFGVWTLLCFTLQAWFAWKLLGLISNNTTLKIFSLSLFIFSPPMLARIGLWTSLASHFLILAALYLNLRPSQKNRFFYWLILILISALTHFYLLVMILILWVASLFDGFIIKKNYSIKGLLATVSIIFLALMSVLWQAGYFSIDAGSGKAGGYGAFRLNLLALFDSREWSYILPNIPMQIDFSNGFNYLGLGALVGLICILLDYFFSVFFGPARPNYKSTSGIDLGFRNFPFLYLSFIFLTFFSITNVIAIGSWQYVIPMPEQIVSAASFLRASGRMFWPVFYFILFLIINYIQKNYQKSFAITLLGVLCVIQIVDTSAGWRPIRYSLSHERYPNSQSPLVSPVWNDFGAHYKKLERYPVQNQSEDWQIFASFAAQNSMGTNSVFLARFDEVKLSQSNDTVNRALRYGPLNNRVLYVVDLWKRNPTPLQFDGEKDVLARIDGYNVLAPGWKICASCPPIPPELELQRLAPITTIGETIEFSQKAFGRREFLLEGWAPYGEAWGTWSEGVSASLLLPVPAGNPKMVNLTVRAFVNEKHPKQQGDVYINGTLVKHFELKDFASNLIEVPISRSVQKDEFFKLELKIQSPASPKALGMSEDNRSSLATYADATGER